MRIAVGQQKGGVGKSTLAIHLAAAAVARGKSAAIIDLDAAQGTSRRWRGRREADDIAVMPADSDAALKKALQALADTDVVIFDLPGRADPLSASGIAKADFVVLPARPNDVDFEAVIPTAKTAAQLNRPFCFVLNAARTQQRANLWLKALTASDQPICPTVIMERDIVPDAISEGTTVIESKATSKQVKDAAREYMAVFDWVLAQGKGERA